MNRALDLLAPAPAAVVLDGYPGDEPLVDLAAGTPWYGPPESFRAAMTALVEPGSGELRDHDRYAPARGAPALREAIARLYRDEHGLVLDPDRQVLVTQGATGAVWTVVLATTSAGDDVVLPNPCYSLYEPIVTALGRRPVRVTGDPEHGFLLAPEDLRGVITTRTRLLLLNSPVNPTGAVYRRERLEALADVAADAGLTVAHDEVLDQFSWRQPHVPLLSLGRPGMVTINSLSKRLGITGWRIGWVAGDREVVDAAARFHPLLSIAVGHAAQVAAATALAAPDAARVLAERVAEVRAAGTAFLSALSGVPGFTARMPDGGVYAFADVTELAERFAIAADQPDVGVAKLLRDRCGVAVLPGSAFGSAGAGRVRISLAAPAARLVTAARRLERLR